MTTCLDIWAVVPIKSFAHAKQRLAGGLSPQFRHGLAAVMAEDVLGALLSCRQLAGILVVTADPGVRALAERMGVHVLADDAANGQTAAVAAAVRWLMQHGISTLLAVPSDIPGITAVETEAVIAAHRAQPGFTIVPAHDRRGSNAILCTPPDCVALAYGNDSFLPHLAAARLRAIEPTIVTLPGIGLDIDNPEDLRAFAAMTWRTKTAEYLLRTGFTGELPKQACAS